jgi:hypothetical protein
LPSGGTSAAKEPNSPLPAPRPDHAIQTVPACRPTLRGLQTRAHTTAEPSPNGGTGPSFSPNSSPQGARRAYVDRRFSTPRLQPCIRRAAEALGVRQQAHRAQLLFPIRAWVGSTGRARRTAEVRPDWPLSPCFGASASAFGPAHAARSAASPGAIHPTSPVDPPRRPARSRRGWARRRRGSRGPATGTRSLATYRAGRAPRPTITRDFYGHGWARTSDLSRVKRGRGAR